MKPALLALGTAGLLVQASDVAPPVPPKHPGDLPTDPKDKQPLLLGPTTAKAILAHRAVFRDNTAEVDPPTKLRRRWKAVKQPLTLVAVFGSWCSDSKEQLPELLALDEEPNPFIEVHYLGVYRDKVLDPSAWPKGCLSQKVAKVPTFYLFEMRPGGGQKLVGTIVETPPKADQTMVEALVELVESAAKRGTR